MYNIHIIDGYGFRRKVRTEIYDKVKHAIPNCLKRDFPCEEDGEAYFPLMPDTAEYAYVLEMAKKLDAHVEIHEKTVYTPEEERNSEFFYMWLSIPMELEAVFLKNYGTRFYDGCSLCDANKRLDGDAFIDRKLVKKKPILQLTDSMIGVSKPLRYITEEYGLTGFNFDHKLKDYKGRDMDEYFCVEPTENNILPPMHEKMWFLEWCKVNCEHPKNYLYSNVKYSRKSLANAKDLNFTYEFGPGLNPNRYLIVSKKLKDVFDKHNIRVGFMPVVILDDN